jgi:hypothetical protein
MSLPSCVSVERERVGDWVGGERRRVRRRERQREKKGERRKEKGKKKKEKGKKRERRCERVRAREKERDGLSRILAFSDFVQPRQNLVLRRRCMPEPAPERGKPGEEGRGRALREERERRGIHLTRIRTLRGTSWFALKNIVSHWYMHDCAKNSQKMWQMQHKVSL